MEDLTSPPDLGERFVAGSSRGRRWLVGVV